MMFGLGAGLVLFLVGLCVLYLAKQVSGGSGITAGAEIIPGCIGVICLGVGVLLMLLGVFG